jgi:hypothetical protein
MQTFKFSHPDYPTTYTVTLLEKGESKGWAGDKYISQGPSTVIIEETPAQWIWTEYDNPAIKADERLFKLSELGWGYKAIS